MEYLRNSKLHPSDVAIIREIYDTEYARYGFSYELEKALTAKYAVIVIEPTELGDETARWINFGNYLHATAILTGVVSIASGFAYPDQVIPQGIFCIFSVLSSSLYTVSWQFDHCVKYQVEKDQKKLTYFPIVAAPVVLVRKEDRPMRYAHCVISITAVAFCIYRLWSE